MELKDEITIAAPRDVVFAALNDPEILRRAIPGCEELEKLSDTAFAARVVLKVGPVKARFSGQVTLDPSGAPGSFSLTGEGNGGAAGFAKGGADVTLEDRGAETMLVYTARAEIGGKLAQLGSRLVHGTVHKLAGRFFAALAEELAGKEAA